MGGQLAQHSRVVTAIDDDSGVGVIFGAGANHGGAADIDILDSIFKCAIGLGYRGGKGVEIDHHHVDRRDIVLSHDCIILAATSQDAAVNFRVQRFNAAIHDFGEACVLRHFFHGNSIFLQ